MIISTDTEKILDKTYQFPIKISKLGTERNFLDLKKDNQKPTANTIFSSDRLNAFCLDQTPLLNAHRNETNIEKSIISRLKKRK